MNKLTLPKSCCSCQHYTPIGFKDDEHCPHTYKNGIGKKQEEKHAQGTADAQKLKQKCL